MTRILYAYIPITSFEDPEQVSQSLEKIKAKVRELTQKYSETNDGFVVVEITEVGRYEKVDPIWTDAPSTMSGMPSGGKPASGSSGG